MPLANPKGSLRQYYGIREGFGESQGQQKRKDRNDISTFFMSRDMFAPMAIEMDAVYGFSFNILFKLSIANSGLEWITSVRMRVMWFRQRCKFFTLEFKSAMWNWYIRQHVASKEIVSARCAHQSNCKYIWRKHGVNLLVKTLWYWVNHSLSRAPVKEPQDWCNTMSWVALLSPTHSARAPKITPSKTILVLL